MTTLVSMLTMPENVELELAREALAAAGAGLRFISVPIEDRGVPERAVFFIDAVKAGADELCAGGAVVVHCRMGVGRSSMFAASTMVRLGVEPDDAWSAIERVRGRPVPDVAKQREWVSSMCSVLRR